MGKKNKNKNKAREAEGTYIVVVDPWGTPNHPNFVNNVAAWFEVMLADDHDDMRVEVVYTHKQHHNVILEFPEQFDVSPYLGSHAWKSFLSAPYNANPDIQHRQSFVYAYNFAKYLEPGQRGWKTNLPSYDRIPPNFPIKSPYPTPGPALPPTLEVPYAIPPKNVVPFQAPSQAVWGTQASQEGEQGSSKGKKDSVDDFLNSLDIDLKPTVATHETEGVDIKPVVKEEIKEEHIPEDHQLSNAPSPPQPRVKAEEEDIKPRFTPADLSNDEEGGIGHLPPAADDNPDEDGYQPSAELLAAFAGLPQNYLSESAPTSSSLPTSTSHYTEVDRSVRVKDEPSDDPPFGDLRGRSMTLASEHGTPQPSHRTRIKPEPSEPSLRSPPRRQQVSIKPEPQDTFRIPSVPPSIPKPSVPRPAHHAPIASNPGRVYDRSRDPRVARMQGVKREQEEVHVGVHGGKRVKMEPN